MSDDSRMEEPKRYGRGVFLATVAAGLTSLAWGRPVWSKVSAALSPAEGLVPLVPSGGWRIYTVSGSMPRFDPATFLAPRSELPDPLPFVLTVVVIGVAVVALAGWIAVRSVRTARTAELIRA